MSVSIRLHRAGSNKKPFFRLVAADSRRATSGKILEVLGWYDPKKPYPDNFSLNMERIEHWLSVGAHMSETARALVRTHRRRASASS
ncbi:MAG: 30S ribosomal protein S16 [Kiritimatiellae bacterium]|nr:30S ribosomal protein S16 [Kiritimatiellia bacterium]